MIYEYSIYIIILILFFLFVAVFIRKKKPSTFGHIITHILLYLFEIVSVTTLLTWLITDNTSSFLILLRNYVFSYTLYQLILLVTFKLIDSLNTDAWTSIKKLNDQAQVFAEFKRKFPEDKYNESRKIVTDTKISFNAEQRLYLQSLLDMIHAFNNEEIDIETYRCYLKLQSIELDNELKMLNYGWMNSILLRLFK